MAKIYILKNNPGSVDLYFQGSIVGARFDVQSLVLSNSSLSAQFSFDMAMLEGLPGGGADEYVFRSSATFSNTVQLQADGYFLGVISGGVATSAELKIQLPASPASPFLTLVVNGEMAIAFAPAAGVNEGQSLFAEITYKIIFNQFPGFDGIPDIELSFPKFNIKLPKIRLPKWHFPNFPVAPIDFPDWHFIPINGDECPVGISWKKLTLDGSAGPNYQLVIHELQVEVKDSPLKLVGDLTLKFDGTTGVIAGSRFDLLYPNYPIDFKDLYISKTCFAAHIAKANTSILASAVVPGIQSTNIETTEAIFRVLFSETGGSLQVTEIRCDKRLEASQTERFTFPGASLELPSPSFISTICSRNGNGLTKAFLGISLDDQQSARLATNFAWMRDDNREIHNSTQHASLFRLTATPMPKTLVATRFDFGEDKLPSFAEQLADPLTPLNFADKASLASPSGINDVAKLNKDDWQFKFDFNLGSPAADYVLTVLNGLNDKLEQGLKIIDEAVQIINLFEKREVLILLPLGLSLGTGLDGIRVVTILRFSFDNFALSVDHSAGIYILLDDKQYPAAPGVRECLGLSWRFSGAPAASLPLWAPLKADIETIIDPEEKTRATALLNNLQSKFHYFTLFTDKYDYKLVQAPGSHVVVSYNEISDEPIEFLVDQLCLSSAGIDLIATVKDEPVTINGISTKFKFSGSKLEVSHGKLKGFTLSGSGPLPPDLVGNGTAKIDLEFGPKIVDGQEKLKFLNGAAVLEGEHLLKCSDTRFKLQISAIGLKFVNEIAKGQERFHLYFTLSGTACLYLEDDDDEDWALGPLSKIKFDFTDAPLARDLSGFLQKRINFLVELPEVKPFDFFGCFKMELRGIGFYPHFEKFDGPAIMLGGQINFAEGDGDAKDPATDYHKLYIGLPGPDDVLPKIYLSGLPLNIAMGEAFKLSGSVDFYDEPTKNGFSGQGVLQIKGMPTMAASFSFVRARKDNSSKWLRAWFIYIEMREVSFMLPVIQLYIREIGLGFGYRYTLVAIKEADRSGDARQLLKVLKATAATQGDLSKVDRWALDLEDAGTSPLWTIVFRAMISQASASTSPMKYKPDLEKDLSCLFLLDAVIAFRSDLTFLMSSRCWLNTNYHDFNVNEGGIREHPLFLGFVYLSPRQRRLLANVSTNPGGKVGKHPELPEFVRKAITATQFSATLLVEPGLFHSELGWPNMLRWSDEVGPLKADFRGGLIFRVSKTELVTGMSFLARASLKFETKLDKGFLGVSLSATAKVGFGARYIGLIDFRAPAKNSAIYAAIGLDIRIRVTLKAWLELDCGFFSITLRFSFSLYLQFTISVEVGLLGISPSDWGFIGRGTIAVEVMGHSLHLAVKLSVNDNSVREAKNRTERFLKMGLEATESDSVPGITTMSAKRGSDNSSELTSLPSPLSVAAVVVGETPAEAQDATPAGFAGEERRADLEADAADGDASASPALEIEPLECPNYSVFAIRNPKSRYSYFCIFPAGYRLENGQVIKERGFLPRPPLPADDNAVEDFCLSIPSLDDFEILERYDHDQKWLKIEKTNEKNVSWKAKWKKPKFELDDAEPIKPTVGQFVFRAFRFDYDQGTEKYSNVGDPKCLEETRVLVDNKDRAVDAEPAVRGAMEQFAATPFFKFDPMANEYDKYLQEAFRPDTSIYVDETVDPNSPFDDPKVREENSERQAHQTRSIIIQDLIEGCRRVALDPLDSGIVEPFSTIGQLGLLFRYKPADNDKHPDWLADYVEEDKLPKIRQRKGDVLGPKRDVRLFNLEKTSFSKTSPTFSEVRQIAHSNAIAIDWELEWDIAPDGLDEPQRNPNSHLKHYQVRRRCLNFSEPPTTVTVKDARVLHRVGKEEFLTSLLTRFKFVDHFDEESSSDIESLPPEGKLYVYTITPVDFADQEGEPLIVMARRKLSEPPYVPTDPKLELTYTVNRELLEPTEFDASFNPPMLPLDSVTLELRWTNPIPSDAKGGSRIPAKYFLIFRRETALPVGYYGVDSESQRPTKSLLSSSNARRIPSDEVLDITEVEKVFVSSENIYSCTIDTKFIEDMLPAQLYPEIWRPESFRIFIQTQSVGGVLSSLVPVQLSIFSKMKNGTRTGEMRPLELEWIPRLVELPFVLAQDGVVKTGMCHVPMPQPFKVGLDSLKTIPLLYCEHPKGLRAINLKWNSSPSMEQQYDRSLAAGFRAYLVDLDRETSETLASSTRLRESFRHIKDVQLIPRSEIRNIPADTLKPASWEAWYRSDVCRSELTKETSEFVPKTGHEASNLWYSWKESMLDWPDWPGVVSNAEKDAGPSLSLDVVRKDSIHFYLSDLIYEIATYKDNEDNEEWIVELQESGATKFANIEEFFSATKESADPYGWGVLQNFGLSAVAHFRTSNGFVVGTEKVLSRLAKIFASNPSLSLTFNLQKLMDGVDEYIREKELVVEPAIVVAVKDQLRQESTGQTLNSDNSFRYIYGRQKLIEILDSGLASLERQSRLGMIEDVLAAGIPASTDPDFSTLKFVTLESYRKHLFTELLICPGASSSLQSEKVAAEDLLTIVQFSLRPVMKQILQYRELELEFDVAALPDGAAAREQSFQLKVPSKSSTPAHALELPLGILDVLEKTDPVPLNVSEPGSSNVLKVAFQFEELPEIEGQTRGRTSLVVRTTKPELFSANSVEAPITAVKVVGVIGATDPLTAKFGVDQEWINHQIRYVEDSDLYKQLDHFATYLITSMPEEAIQKYRVKDDPTAERFRIDLVSKLDSFLIWTQRFFDHGMSPADKLTNSIQIASAYPRASSPLPLASDEMGRLNFNHVVEDLWAHAFRFYIKPIGRYELLYESWQKAHQIGLSQHGFMSNKIAKKDSSKLLDGGNGKRRICRVLMRD
ncbi:MAG: hypothetical protein IPP97_26665 [Candidatus Obscuribacter sp.]|nr:hypothetical protein [Candidatus Obscuribacter sp.]